jgi:hypothetical protein
MSVLELFHSSFSTPEFNATAMRHFGSLTAASNRIESTFYANQFRAFNGHDKFTLCNPLGMPVGEETTATSLEKFCNHASSCFIYKHEVTIKNSLTLADKWDDDPIASGGMRIFDQSGLSTRSLQQLKTIFYPFDNIIHPEHVHQMQDAKKLKGIKKKCMSNSFSNRELNKRKKRSLAIGIEWDKVVLHESLWVDLTMKLRLWALENNYDSFVYQNTKEGTGDNSFVCLNDNQAPAPSAVLRFDRDKYMSEIAPTFNEFLLSQGLKNMKKSNSYVGVITNMFWGGKDPVNFWSEAKA